MEEFEVFGYIGGLVFWVVREWCRRWKLVGG